MQNFLFPEAVTFRLEGQNLFIHAFRELLDVEVVFIKRFHLIDVGDWLGSSIGALKSIIPHRHAGGLEPGTMY